FIKPQRLMAEAMEAQRQRRREEQPWGGSAHGNLRREAASVDEVRAPFRAVHQTGRGVAGAPGFTQRRGPPPAAALFHLPTHGIRRPWNGGRGESRATQAGGAGSF